MKISAVKVQRCTYPGLILHSLEDLLPRSDPLPTSPKFQHREFGGGEALTGLKNLHFAPWFSAFPRKAPGKAGMGSVWQVKKIHIENCWIGPRILGQISENLLGMLKASKIMKYPEKGNPMTLDELYTFLLGRKANPKPGSYTNSLFDEGLPRLAQKVGEEGVEVAVAALVQDDERLIEEIADLAYHTLVLMAARGISPAQIQAELERRHS
jgi:phosphoribosyl-ATP pyrophosphohydrolase